MPNYAPFAPFMTILRSMNVCSIDSRAAMGGRTLIRMLGSTGLQISFDQEIANAEKRRQILRKKEMTTFERR